MTQFQTLWLVFVALSLFGTLRLSFSIMASTGLIALAFPGTLTSEVACAVSAVAALVDMFVLARLTIRGMRS